MKTYKIDPVALSEIKQRIVKPKTVGDIKPVTGKNKEQYHCLHCRGILNFAYFDFAMNIHFYNHHCTRTKKKYEYVFNQKLEKLIATNITDMYIIGTEGNELFGTDFRFLYGDKLDYTPRERLQKILIDELINE